MFSVETHTKDDRRGKETKGDSLLVGAVNALCSGVIIVEPELKEWSVSLYRHLAAGCCSRCWRVCLCRLTVSSTTSGVELLFCTVTTGARGSNSQISDWWCTEGSDVSRVCRLCFGLIGGKKGSRKLAGLRAHNMNQSGNYFVAALFPCWNKNRQLVGFPIMKDNSRVMNSG